MQGDTTDGTRRITLDERRFRARWKSVAAALIGVATHALTAAMLTFVAIFAIARLWTWIRGRDIDQFFLWDLAPGAAVAVAVLSLLAAAALIFRYFWVGAADRVLRELSAARVDGPGADIGELQRSGVDRLLGVVEGLAIGSGRERPEVWVVHDDTPNSLSLRSTQRRVLVVTSGTLDLPRHEQEALAAHEIVHLSALDAHWVTSGLVALTTARRVGMEVWAAGVVLLVLSGYLAYRGTAMLWGTAVVGVGLFLTGGLAGFTYGRLERSVRHHADELADVGAVHLAKDPLSLGKLCLRLADLESQVGPAPTSAESLWFEMVHPPMADGKPDAFAVVRSRRDMYQRARRAYAEAREPLPADAEARIAHFLARNSGA